MELSHKLHPTTIGFGVSVALSSVASTVLLIVKEENKQVLAFMKSLLGHHWTTHGVFVFILFFVLGFLFTSMSSTLKIKGFGLALLLLLSSAFASIATLGYFLLPYIR